jgi:hypothetical protein
MMMFHYGMHSQVDILLSSGDIPVPHDSLQGERVTAIGDVIRA